MSETNIDRINKPKKPVPAVKVSSSITHMTQNNQLNCSALQVFAVLVGRDSQSSALHWSVPGAGQHGTGTVLFKGSCLKVLVCN